MDDHQFKKLLDSFASIISENQQKLIEQLQSQNTNVPSDSFINIAPFENFDTKKEKFSCYLERFENYLAVKNVISTTKKAPLLCASIGSIHYNSLSAYLGPEKAIKDLQYNDLVKCFSQMLTPKKNIVVSQHYFLSTYQNEKQTLSEYVAVLQSNLADCDFYVKCKCDQSVSIAEILMRAQFIRGIRDNWIREQLLQSDATKFEDILAKAIALEASRIQSKELIKTSSFPIHSENNQNDVNKINQSNYSRHQSRSPHRRNSQRFQNYETPNRSRSSSHHNHSQSRSKFKIDYHALGIDNLCLRCGKGHRSNFCRVNRRNLKCGSCNACGHVDKACIKTLLKTKVNTKQLTLGTHSQSDSNYTYGVNNIAPVLYNSEIIDLFEVNSNSEKYLITVSINGKSQQMEVDSGAKYSILPEDKFVALNLNTQLKSTNISFRGFKKKIVQCKGKVEVTVVYKYKSIIAELYIVPPGYDSLIGRDWIRKLGLELKQIDSDMSLNSIINSNSISVLHMTTVDNILHEFPSIFEEKIGCIPNFQISLKLRENAKPIYIKERDVPYALRQRVENELDILEKEGIITPVNTSDWGSPLVVIPKPDGGVRLCVDYKCGVNNRLENANFPISPIEDVLSSLRNSAYFCKLDLYKAYLHLPVDIESSKIQTITTHRGTYRMNRLSFGIKTAPADFNRAMSQILQGLPKCAKYYDDIIVHGTTLEECAQNLRLCLQRLSQYDLHVNRNKCTFFEKRIEYLGHIIEQNKIMKSPDKVRAVTEMPRPTNVDEVRRFLGMLTYYSRFLPDFSSISYPLRKLLCKNQHFHWSCKCESAFLKLKAEMCSNRILVPYDPNLPIVLTSDASPVGIAAVLSHIIQGEEKPIAYASRSLSSSEINYSQLDREALAIVFAVNRFYNYIYGRSFTLVTDNEPLTRIFGHNQALPRMTSARLLRYASFLSGFNYTVKFKKGKENENVDCLSRAPVSQILITDDILINEEVNQIYSESLFQISQGNLTANAIAKETSNDPELQRNMKDLQSMSENSPFTILNGILFRNERVVIPSNLRSPVLKELHATHVGITKMKQLARRYVYWKGIDRDIEHLVKSCEICAKLQRNPPKAVIHPWDDPETNWERIHIDYAGPFEGHYFLLCIDAKSKWAEIRVLKNAPSSNSTINLLNDIFSFHGYPSALV